MSTPYFRHLHVRPGTGYPGLMLGGGGFLAGRVAPVGVGAPVLYPPLGAGCMVASRGAGVTAGGGWMQDEARAPTDEDAIGLPLDDETEYAARHFGAAYALLEYNRPDLAQLARFAHGIELATFHMCAAFEQAGVRDFRIDVEPTRRGATSGWFAWLAQVTFARFRTLRGALLHDWTPPAEVEPYTYAAFHSLCDLTPAASNSLRRLFFRQRPQAIEGLVAQLDHVARMLEEAIALASEAGAAVTDKVAEEDATRLALAQADVLASAGETLGLRDAASALGMTHQNLHKRIDTGSALGVMQGRRLLVPSIQFVENDGRVAIVDGLRNVLRVFREAEAGEWSALQFLVEKDPALGAVPIERLKAGDTDAVEAAARAYLGMDES